ncbi:MAG: AmmeMemoRadiSam system protein B [Myxococcales bacterium]|nr:AmmeMemoRadiSam system protein B [Myxococcales bacterium]
MTSSRPRLRAVERLPLARDDEAWIVLRDPLGLSEPVTVPSEAGPLLDLLDGQRTPAQIRQSLLMRGALDIPTADIEALVADLSDAGLLDDPRFRARWQAHHEAFLEAPTRAPRHAGTLYPDDPETLRATLSRALPGRDGRFAQRRAALALICPHQPAQAIPDLLDATARDLPPAEQLDAIVILGTDHGVGLTPYAATGKRYQTPLGEAPAAARLLAELEEQLPWITREEIRHRAGHSVELAVCALHYLYEDSCPPILPILCGQSSLARREGLRAEVDDFLAAMGRALARRRVLLWTSAELGHAGPAYGGPALPPDASARLERRDRALLQSLLDGRPERLLRACLEDDPQLGRASGSAALVTLARLLPLGYQATLTGYRVASAPGVEPGLAGLAGLRVYEHGVGE